MTNLLLCSLVNVVNRLPTMNTTKTLVRCQTMLIAFIAVFIIIVSPAEVVALETIYVTMTFEDTLLGLGVYTHLNIAVEW